MGLPGTSTLPGGGAYRELCPHTRARPYEQCAHLGLQTGDDRERAPTPVQTLQAGLDVSRATSDRVLGMPRSLETASGHLRNAQASAPAKVWGVGVAARTLEGERE